MANRLAAINQQASRRQRAVIYINDNSGQWRSDFRQTVAALHVTIIAFHQTSQPYLRTRTAVESMKTELNNFYGLIDEIKVAMMITRRPDGHLDRAPSPTRSALTVPTCGSSPPRAPASCTISKTIRT